MNRALRLPTRALARGTANLAATDPRPMNAMGASGCWKCGDAVRVLCSAWLCLVLTAPAFADEGVAVASANEGRHDLLYLTAWKPFILRLQLSYDGVPYRQRWEQLIDERFRALDVNRDGELDRQEKEALKLLQLMPATGPETRSGLLQRNPLTGHPKRSDLATYFAQKQWKSMSFGSASATPAAPVRQRRVNPAADRTVQAGATLLKQIDGDGDGLLSRVELANARHALRKFDFDGNEYISLQELMPQSSLNGFILDPAPQAQPTASDARSNVVDLSGSPPVAIVTRLLQTYCKSESDTGAGCLSRSQIGLSETRFSKFDIDRNGLLSEDEVLDMIQNPEPDAVIVVQFGKVDEGVARLQVRSASEGCVAAVRADGSALVSIEGTDFEVTIEPPPAEDLASRLQQTVTLADRDKNGYVDRGEAGSLGILGQKFAQLDTDADGQLFPKEFEGAALPAALISQAQWRVDATESAVDMFLAIDRNQDSKITIREFREIPTLVSHWDKDGDGQLNASEIPKRIRLQIGTNDLLAQAARGGTPTFVERRVGVVTGDGNRPDLAAAPAWFVRMDRNGDGDISRREFLGKEADFQKLDQDRDDLITSVEAAAVSP